jgi:hypothetical protein
MAVGANVWVFTAQNGQSGHQGSSCSELGQPGAASAQEAEKHDLAFRQHSKCAFSASVCGALADSVTNARPYRHGQTACAEASVRNVSHIRALSNHKYQGHLVVINM